jgi:dihydrofolate reductase
MSSRARDGHNHVYLGGLMRKLILKMHVSLDGFVATDGGNVEWLFEHFDDEMREWEVDCLWQAGVHVMGRVTYGEMAEHWPGSTEPYAPPMNEIPKVVFSKSLEVAEWTDSRVERAKLAEGIAALKREPGKEILAHGGAGFAQSLSGQGLIDEYRLVVHPVGLGAGLPLFSQRVDLALDSTRRFPAGGMALTYHRGPATPDDPA